MALPSSLRPVYVVDAVRTPIARYAGGLAGVRPDDLAAHVHRRARAPRRPASRRASIRWSSAPPTRPGRTTATWRAWRLLLAGLPYEVPAVTVNRLCGSGLEAVADAARMIAVGEAVRARSPAASRA